MPPTLRACCTRTNKTRLDGVVTGSTCAQLRPVRNSTTIRMQFVLITAASRFAACALAACLVVTPPSLAVEPPSAEAQAILRKGFKASSEGSTALADTLLTQSIDEWKRTKQAPDELAAIYKQRGIVRQQQAKLVEAAADLTEALKLVQAPGAVPDLAEVQRTYVLRARVHEALALWSPAEADLTAAINRLDDLDAIESTNPYLYSERASARSRLGDYAGAADDALRAEAEFKAIGDKVRRLLSSADSALAMYGADDIKGGVGAMRFVFKNKGMPASNNPDDIGLLQELSRKDAELHLAYAAHLYGAEGRKADALTQWESGCIRIEAYVADGMQRNEEETALLEKERKEAQGIALKASSVASNAFNNDFQARLNGLDPQSPYVTQRPQRAYFWYKIGDSADGGIDGSERRDPGVAFADVDEGLSCGLFRQDEWMKENRPEWPPNLRTHLKKYATDVPQQLIVMPPKGSPPSKGELVF